ncbi:2-polyprenyl-6-methoxyphenol hydroxylase-like FAD-dependent oxidoreductase [Mycolicibacterium sp. BK556]|uniref:FAD-dependent monooxygenase n=1 Tax=Mycobacteriaceae TaxID=1762 RepID=UPI00105E09E4|nr:MULTISPECIES: FAD-dependent monooxygenase [Mycobacteriaceae]MBB3606199.1 2-polyprenyl-6-methoxyphenol hydroxylase-like FAD-dependent oxidoreductase [Mycolicibacterium sp. BK556]MBB3632777.1 2-polyprenyl-6-methoxyphenol hydroxylase-like FAD-dependent oxidoreductase [Mycolicibacterium sp. BK607]MBB3754126.1 2-polyprenyl-6-methoxyphenol hydroxylase-like FAD-dependent oxidoreductase [Mycolicibacterium sp. BK634]TDO17900.1 flavin-dependent dehydrogenase [Mycobacterium sp. BK086]
MAERGSHAVVLGAGLAGLLAARVLSEFYASVTVVERDALPDHVEQRTGVPQGRHLHSLLSRGTQAIGELFPGILGELGAAGAVVDDGDDLSRLYVRVGQYELNPAGRLADPQSLAAYQSSRPFLEFHLRRRVAALENVEILDRRNMVAPVLSRDAVTGVRIIHRDTGISSILAAGLVVDATGRAGRTAHFLASQGYGTVPEERVASITGYSSQLLRIPPGRIRERMVFINQGPRAQGALFVAYEHDTWMLAISRPTELGRPPADFAEMRDAAAQMLPERIMGAVREAVPVGEISVSRNTAAVWRRYDRMSRLPAGLVVFGDALCSLNPLYGQGMTMAALQALALRDVLRAGDDDVPRRFFLAAAQHIRPVWSENRANDRSPAVAQRPSRLNAAIQRAATRAASTDIAVAERILRVRGLIDPPTRLREPAFFARILLANLRPNRRSSTAAAHSTISHADEQAIRALVDRQARRRTGRTEITRLRYLTPDVALIQARAAIAGRLRCGRRRNTSVAVRTNDGWLLAFSQNTAY